MPRPRTLPSAAPLAGHRLPVLLRATCVAAVLAAVAVTVPRDTLHPSPPHRVSVTADVAAFTYAGPSTDRAAELRHAAEQDANVRAWIAAHTPPPPPPPPASHGHRTEIIDAVTVTSHEGPSDVLAAIAAHFPPPLYSQAVAVARCESTLNPTAIGGPNYGLFQIARVHTQDFEAFTGLSWSEAILQADANAAYARKLYDGEGWSPWACAHAARRAASG